MRGSCRIPLAFDYVAAFKAKLLLHRMKTPDKGAMSRLLWYYPQQMMMMAQPTATLVIWGQQAAAKYDWGLLVVLIAVELGKRRIEDLTGGTQPAKDLVQLSLVLKRCRAVQLSHLKQLLKTFIGRAGWL